MKVRAGTHALIWMITWRSVKGPRGPGEPCPSAGLGVKHAFLIGDADLFVATRIVGRAPGVDSQSFDCRLTFKHGAEAAEQGWRDTESQRLTSPAQRRSSCLLQSTSSTHQSQKSWAACRKTPFDGPRLKNCIAVIRRSLLTTSHTRAAPRASDRLSMQLAARHGLI